MLKKVLFIVLLTNSLFASILMEKIENIIGEVEYTTHKNLINLLFEQEEEFIDDESINYINVINKLNENGLLKLGFDKPTTITLKFTSDYNPKKSLKIFQDTLKSLGYYYYFIKSNSISQEGTLIWSIELKTEAAISPLILSKELQKQSCIVKEITRDNLKWSYVIDTSFSNIIEAIQLVNNEKFKLRKPLKPYYIKVSKGAKRAYIQSRILNNWFPSISFYDEHLNVLGIIKKDKVTNSLGFRLPENTKYIKIRDLYTLINIKRGLSITIKE